MRALPDADAVFHRYFAPWYEPDDLARRGHAATRPDAEWREPSGVRAAALSPLDPDGQREVAERIDAMVDAARGDWAGIPGADGPSGPAWVDAFDRYYDRERVGEVLDDSDPADFSNELVVLCCELGAVLGEVLRRQWPRLEWLYDWPYWESALHDPVHGSRLNVFHWAIRKFSDGGADEGVAARLRQCRTLVAHGWS
jgi:hypothetical protein